MAFVNEPISETDQQRINYSALKDPKTESRIWALPRWTVDHNRDVFFLRLGGGQSPEDIYGLFYFLFSWQGVWMRVDAVEKEMPSDEPMIRILTWEVIRMHLPDVLPVSREEIMHALAEVFDVYGSCSYDDIRAMYSEVHVDFSKLQIAKFDIASVKVKGE